MHVSRFLALAIVGAIILATAAAQPSPAQRAAALLANMTLTDKVNMLHGVGRSGYTGTTAANPALNIPALQLNDGRNGFRPQDGSPTQTAFPCQLSVVATWDKQLFNEFGAAMGAEFAGKGANVMLAPMLILARVPQGGRTFESCGEDPELCGAFAAAHVAGVQSNRGIVANADDFVLNNAEVDRQSISAIADERTRFEIYYRGYAGAIAGGVSSFMCSYNRVNGTYACENGVTLGDLKSPAGLNFTGWVLSDWGGTHSTVAAALAGLDMEMPGADFFGDALVAAVQQGLVPMAVIDDKVLRILTPMFAAGMFDPPFCPPSQCNEDTNVTSPAHTALARHIGGAGAVLAKNANNALPLSSSAIKSLVVVGDDADVSPYCCGAGSGGLSPPYVVSPLQGIITRAGAGVSVKYFPTPPMATALTQWFSAGRGDHFLDFQCNLCPAGPDAYVALRVEAYGAAVPFGGSVELALFYNGATQSNLIALSDFAPPPGYAYVRPLAYALPLNYSGGDETAVLELWTGKDTPNGAPPLSHVDFFTLATAASRAEAVAANYTKVADVARVFVNASLPDFSAIAAAAAAADAAIVCASVASSEGADRADLNMSAVDDATIAAVAAAQPRTIVSLNVPGAVIMPWAAAAAAIVINWYPGQEMGNALADVLFGDVNPSGRLPLTFPVANADTPLQTAEQYPGVNGTQNYTERLEVGYRWFDAAGVAPLFAFGHGLSYTSFAYAALQVSPSRGGAADSVAVAVNVTNSGGVAGREVVQLYVAFPASAGEPPAQLRGFEVVDLAPGATATVSFTLAPRDLSVWDTAAYAWAPAAGAFGILVGASSRDIRVNGTYTLTP